ncbi:MAG: hypothetical protein ACXVAX_07760 [Pseudobdellovibrio sp.]
MLNNILRVLFPAWNFFDEVADSLVVTYCYEGSEDVWKNVDFKPKKPDSFFFKPHENYYLYIMSTLFKLVQQLPALKKNEGVAELKSYRFIEKAVRDQIEAHDGDFFTFRVSVLRNRKPQLIFQSPVIECSRK